MSTYEWERGEIILPSAEFAKVRQALQNADTEHKEKVFAATQEFWKGLSRKEQTDPTAYRDAVYAWHDRERNKVPSYRPGFGYRSDASDERMKVLDSAVDRLHVAGFGKPARVLKSDMQFPTNRTTEFQTGHAYIGFDRARNTVTWAASENNHAVDSAHQEPLSQVFFQALKKVAWTRNTGGVMTGNDEYNREGRGEGEASNYVTTAYGPIGAAEAPGRCEPYTDSKGKRVTEQDLSKMSSAMFQAQMDAERKIDAARQKAMRNLGAQPRGHNGHAGQYTFRNRSEPTFRL